ncbi:hypothetical protein BDV93DRAFT_526897, partial [Ceratobasidium sp. AG-I]
PSFYDCLRTLRLREFVCPTDILSSEHIHALDNLPTLESLEVYYVGDNITPVRRSPPPALRRFVQHSVSWSDFQKIWELGLFSGLTSLEIFFQDTPPVDKRWSTKLFILVRNASPVLENLCIDFGDMAFDLNTTRLLQPLAALPLQTVRFKFFDEIEKPILS